MQWGFNPNAPLYLIFIVISMLLATPPVLYVWQSYRWDLPERWYYFWVFARFGLWFIPGWLELRNNWILKIRDRRSLPY
jgi:hypothetical protein